MSAKVRSPYGTMTQVDLVLLYEFPHCRAQLLRCLGHGRRILSGDHGCLRLGADGTLSNDLDAPDNIAWGHEFIGIFEDFS